MCLNIFACYNCMVIPQGVCNRKSMLTHIAAPIMWGGGVVQ